MNTSPLARALRTIGSAALGFLLLNGVIVGILKALDIGDYRTAFILFVIGGVSALGAGLAALIWNQLAAHPAVTPLGKATATFLETFAAGLLTVVIFDATKAAAVAYAVAIGRLVLAALTAAVHTYTTNRTETSAAAPPAAEAA